MWMNYEFLSSMMRDVSDRKSTSLTRSILTKFKNTNIFLVSFHMWYFVFVHISQPTERHNLSSRLVGPCLIVRVISSHVYVSEYVNNLKREHVHSRRLQLYKSNLDNKEIDANL